MSAPPDFRFFRYHPAEWSLGDWLDLELECDDEPALARLLAPLGLEGVARTKIGGGVAEAFGVAVTYRAFGTTLELVVGPEDRYSFLDATHFAQARRIEDALASAGAEPFVLREPFVIPDDEPTRAAPRRPAGDAYVLALECRTGAGWKTRILRAPQASVVTSIEVTGDTSCEGALVSGAVGRATLGVGRREDGEFGAIAARLEIFAPDDALLERVRRWQDALAALDVALDPPEAATFAALHLVERAEGHAAPIERSMGDALLFARHALPPESAGAHATIVALLRSFRALDFPCLFNVRAGAALRAEIVDQANRCAAAAGDRRRWRTLHLHEQPEPTALLLNDDEARLLIDRGLVRATA